MRTSTSRLALCAAASIFMFPFACADVADPLPSGPTGEVEIAVASLEYQDILGAKYEITVKDGATVVYQAQVTTADYGSPDGRLLFIAPCVAGDAGPKPNQVIVELLEVYVSGQSLPLKHNDGAYFPPPVEKTITCTENADVRADFLLTFVRRAQQGFADIVVQIRDIFCSYKVSCEDNLMAAPTTPYAPGPTLVTGFACTDGDGASSKFIGFEGTLCCDGDTVCTTLSIGAGGAASWSAPGFGVLDTQSYQGAEEILG
ncbi:MAG: hypothetical protein Q8L55_07775, partial [Phycisphaerales bacterium]|nr:hypothetical protein [Phycisphaerales bacterium]